MSKKTKNNEADKGADLMLRTSMTPDMILEMVDRDRQRIEYYQRKSAANRQRQCYVKGICEKALATGKLVTLPDIYKVVSKETGNVWSLVTSVQANGRERGSLDFYCSCYTYVMTERYMMMVVMTGESYGCDVIVFTPHFFRRLYERLDLNVSREDLMRNFIGCKHSIDMNLKSKEHRRTTIFIRYTGCTVSCSVHEKGRVLVARTVLTDRETGDGKRHEMAKYSYRGTFFSDPRMQQMISACFPYSRPCGTFRKMCVKAGIVKGHWIESFMMLGLCVTASALVHVFCRQNVVCDAWTSDGVVLYGKELPEFLTMASGRVMSGGKLDLLDVFGYAVKMAERRMNEVDESMRMRMLQWLREAEADERNSKMCMFDRFRASEEREFQLCFASGRPSMPVTVCGKYENVLSDGENEEEHTKESACNVFEEGGEL